MHRNTILGVQEQRFTPEFDGTIPEHLVDIAWDMTMKRKALIGAALDARFKYFVAQLAMSIPPMSCKEVGGTRLILFCFCCIRTTEYSCISTTQSTVT